MAQKNIKTNAIRILQKEKLEFTVHDYQNTNAISGDEIVAVLKENPKRVFKTLVTVAKSGEHYVFMIPVENELDLKKAALSVEEKSVSMIKSKELLPLTGYIHGGCSPIGMKKLFTTVVHSTFTDFETVYFSAGKIGLQIETSPQNLKQIINYKIADLTVKI